MEAVECFCSFYPKKLSKLGSIKPKSKPVSGPGPVLSPGSSSGSGSGSGRSSREEEGMREVFRRFDGDGDGKISAAELRSYLGSVGEPVSSEAAEGVVGHLDSDNDMMLGFEDFMRMMAEEGGGEELRAAFGAFEWEGTGRITARSLQRALGRLGDPRSYDECVAMIRVFDADGNGGIGFDQFRQMMTAAA